MTLFLAILELSYYNVEYSIIALFLPIAAVHSVGRTMTFDFMAVFSSIVLFMIIAVTCQACPTVERLGATTFISACAVQPAEAIKFCDPRRL